MRIPHKPLPLWTNKPCIEMDGTVHLLQGNGPGNPGLYAKGRPWCRIRVKKYAIETDKPCTCPKCKQQVKVYDQARKGKKKK